MSKTLLNPALLVVTALTCFQAAPLALAQSAGQADVALQGYYLGGSGQPLLQTTGAAVNFSEVIPGVGMLTGDTEAYGSDGLRTGNMFVGFKGVPLGGWHWDFMGGDFQFAYNQVPSPFLNIYTPDISGRGFRVVMQRKDRNYQFFVGEDTLLAGPRIPYRLMLPQQVMGASMWQKVGDHWEFGVRYLHLSTSPSALVNYSNYFFPGSDYHSADALTFQSSYHFTRHLKFYSEVGYHRASTFTGSTSTSPDGSQVPVSLLVGPDWETDKFTLKANYVRESTSYLPLLGYFVGGRQGPYLEGRYRPIKKLEFYGSADQYSNNLENNPQVPTFHSYGYTAGSTLQLPWRVSGSATLSIINITERQPSVPGETTSNNRQLNLNLIRPIKHHSLRLTCIDMSLNSNNLPQAQRFVEMEDDFTWKRLVIGGAVREQNTTVTQSVNTLFYRGSLQTNLKRVSIYGYFEKGNDLVNRSVFSTNAYSSDVAGVSAPLLKGWNVQVEAYRNSLLTALNPENIFLFGNTGLGLNSQLAASNQWNVYVRISKHFHWGKPIPGGVGLDEYAAKAAPLVGNVQGLVTEQALAGPRPASNVAVSLDQNRSAFTDASGHYTFADVPEGMHEVGLNMEQLPTDYEPRSSTKGKVQVLPRSVARADFNVVRLTMFSGKVVAPAGAHVENVVIRLNGTDRYTTPYQDGSFYFYNLREGDYAVTIDTQTIPEGYLLASPASSVQVSPRSSGAPPHVEFELKPKPEPAKPVREILHQEIHVGGEGGANQEGSSQKGGSGGPGTGGTQHGNRGGSSKGSGGATGRGGRGATGNGAGRGDMHSGSRAANARSTQKTT